MYRKESIKLVSFYSDGSMLDVPNLATNVYHLLFSLLPICYISVTECNTISLYKTNLLILLINLPKLYLLLKGRLLVIRDEWLSPGMMRRSAEVYHVFFLDCRFLLANSNRKVSKASFFEGIKDIRHVFKPFQSGFGHL